MSLIKFIKQRICGYAWVFSDEFGIENFRVFENLWGAFEYGKNELNIPLVELELLRIGLGDKKNRIGIFSSKGRYIRCERGRTQ
ncbi:hypothetical protein EB077_11210 [bacterium]|nr:hypothetical protein [bacterium]